MFEKLHTFANHLGLFSEEISSRGELVGNFPHLALHSAAYSLDRILDQGKYGRI